MWYQVLARVSAEVAWEPFQAMTRDPLQAMKLLQKASRSYDDVSIIQAQSASMLREQTRRLRAGEPTGQEVSPVPGLSATPRVSLIAATIESQRWAIEQGPGGDHDVPYHFEPPISAHTLARWAQLMAAAQSQEAEALRADALADGAAKGDTLTLESIAEPMLESTSDETAAPTTVRSERIS